MQTDGEATESLAETAEIMGSVDSGEVRQYVIADVTQDDSWLSVSLCEATTLSAWR
jgi:hypothetical protein